MSVFRRMYDPEKGLHTLLLTADTMSQYRSEFERLDLEGDGYDWDSLIRKVIGELDGLEKDALTLDPESSMVAVRGNEPALTLLAEAFEQRMREPTALISTLLE